MSKPFDKILHDLLSGNIVGTRPKDNVKYGTNQVPDIIRKIRDKFGEESVKTIDKKIIVNGHTTVVAEYMMSTHVAAHILGKQYRSIQNKQRQVA